MTVVDFVWAERRLVELLGAEKCLWMLDVDAWVDYLGTHALRIVVASSIGLWGISASQTPPSSGSDPIYKMAIGGLSMGERTGSRVFHHLWPYVLGGGRTPSYVGVVFSR